MSYPANARTPVVDRFWAEGCNTLIFPTDIQPGYYYWGENIVNRGGVIQTRPGRDLLFTLPGKNAQGLGFYRPYQQKEQLVWAIDGKVYWSEFPFTSYHWLSRIQFYKNAPQVFFCQARQEVMLNPDGSLTLMPTPADILFIQDGYTASAFYEATNTTYLGTNGHNKSGAPWLQCPVGTCMASVGSRLWVAQNETIFASDFLNPNSFTERTYLAEADGFKLPETCRGLLATPEQDALLAFSSFTITSLQAGILERTAWQNTQNFQRIVSANYGSVGSFSPVNQFGLPWFYSEVGLLSVNEALNQYRSSRVNPQDNEMLRSKMNMSPLRAGVCGVSFENWLLMAVPSGSKYNRHTWVMDGAPMSQLGSQAGPCWAGIWTGTYPVQFATGQVQDVPRCFELSYSCSEATATDGSQSRIQLWEDFVGRRTDHNDTPIECSWETKIFEISQTGELCRFKYCEIDVVELVGIVSLQIYYAGIKGHYRLIYEVTLAAEEGLPGSETAPLLSYAGLVTDTMMDSFRPQCRTVRTPDYSGSQDEADNCADTCGIETPYQHNVDKGFQLLFNWQGRMGIRELRLFVEPYPQPGIGTCTEDEAGKVNIVSSVGCLPPAVSCGWTAEGTAHIGAIP
jgi:hypothetical protein